MTRPVFRARSTSHTVAAHDGCTKIPLAAHRAQEDENHSRKRRFRPWLASVRLPGSARTDQVLEDNGILFGVFVKGPSSWRLRCRHLWSHISRARPAAFAPARRSLCCVGVLHSAGPARETPAMAVPCPRISKRKSNLGSVIPTTSRSHSPKTRLALVDLRPSRFRATVGIA